MFYPTTRRLSYVNSELQACVYGFDHHTKGGECPVVFVLESLINFDCLEFLSVENSSGCFYQCFGCSYH